MRILFDKYPVDIILCMLCSVVVLITLLLDVTQILRIILGLPFILFIPGYTLISALFPTRKTDPKIGTIERIILSVGFSIAIVPLIGLCLNYTPWGIQLESVFPSIFVFVLSVGTIAIYRWFKTAPDERFVISLNLSSKTSETKLDKALTIILIASIILAATFLVYAISTPKNGEKFTSFYLLGPDRNATDYPRNLTMGENTNIIIGITNHEYQTINYTIEIWLINQTSIYNQPNDEKQTIYHNMWFMDKIEITLDHTSLNIENSWSPQLEYNYTFNISKEGQDFKLAFLLFKKNTENYNYNEDYRDIIEHKLSSAYRELHLWITVTQI